MDFTGQYSFPRNNQSYHQPFMTMPPLTPSHSQSAGSDDFNLTSPTENFTENLNGETFNNFDYNQNFNGTTFGGPPTPPNPAFGQQQSQRHHHRRPSTNGSANGSSMRGDNASRQNQDSAGDDLQSQFRGGSDEDDLTPAQSRRKAQNRAAQRAFRERKERHVKDLETKLASLEAAQQHAADENERLKRDLQKISTENEILRATSAYSHHSSHSPEPMTTGPIRFTPTDFYSSVLQGHTNKSPSHRIVTSDDGQRLLAAGACWDFIISHELYKRGLVDVGKVSDRLKQRAKCDGQGPVFSEADVTSAIMQSVASGSDDLL